MISRKYTRKIKIYKTESISDGYGGNTVSDVLIGSFWAEVKQNSAFKDNSLGKADVKSNYSFKNKKSTMLVVDFVAGVEGFEPSQAVLETDVLPLTLYPYIN